MTQSSESPLYDFFLGDKKKKSQYFEIRKTTASFGGRLLELVHYNSTTKSKMELVLYLPSPILGATSITTTTIIETADSGTTATITNLFNSNGSKFPVLIFLTTFDGEHQDGADCGFLQLFASQKGIAIVYPDTSPRFNDKLCHKDEKHPYCGTGASFYLNATRNPWYKNYQMESYITKKLPKHLFHDFPELDASRISIMGFGMGGHGALTLFLKNPGMYKSVSAIAPICNPINCELGKSVLTGYLGTYEENEDEWKMNDATELVRRWLKGPFPCLIDIGTRDALYLEKQLLPENFAEAANMSYVGQGLKIRYQEVKHFFPIQAFSVERKLAKYHQGYHHSYHFVSSFASDHVNFAAEYLFA